MKRREFLTRAAGGGAAALAASSFPKPAVAQGVREWRMVTTWPENFPGLGTGANLLAKFITEGSEGRLKVKVFGAGKIVPAFEAMDAVGNGTVEMGHGAPYYWKGKANASQFLSGIPFGFTAQEQNAWYQYGGGQQLADRIYKELGCKFFVSGNTGCQMGGWFNKEINSAADLKGLKMRIPGLGGEVVKAAGGTPVNLAGGDIAPALQSGAIDATEWVGPYNDLAFGFYKNAKYYYYPGWHEPSGVLDNFVNLKAWESLPADLKALVEAANAAANLIVLDEFVARNNDSLEVLRSKHNVQLRAFPNDALNELGRLSGEVLIDQAKKDKLSQETFDSILAFRKTAIAWSNLSERAYLAARALPFKYAG
ncbi:MAG: TRAP transporter substrate-binding protein [Proteobacteria bacterium]|nr:TRAP transporter substrate-binding protein [Pseudomonadota bacterium]